MPICKCCGEEAPQAALVDFNKTCHDRKGPRVFHESDVYVPYYKCTKCGFIFTNFCDNWTREDYIEKIYNNDYAKADPEKYADAEIKDTEAYKTGAWLAGFIKKAKDDIRVLDFGAGGNPGKMGQALVDAGFKVTSYEPYFVEGATAVEGKYNFIYAIEVLEHCADVQGAAQFISDHLADNGILFIATLLHNHPSPDQTVRDSWYIAPRNGHISIFTFPALVHLFRSVGVSIVLTMQGLVGFKNIPNYPNSFFAEPNKPQ